MKSLYQIYSFDLNMCFLVSPVLRCEKGVFSNVNTNVALNISKTMHLSSYTESLEKKASRIVGQNDMQCLCAVW